MAGICRSNHRGEAVCVGGSGETKGVCPLSLISSLGGAVDEYGNTLVLRGINIDGQNR